MTLEGDTHTLTDFTQRPSEIINQLCSTGRPVVLTVNGQASVVVQDLASYERLLESLDHAETIAGIRRGLEDIAAGRTYPARQALEELRLKYEAPR
jgi:prevent-host-death family protein